MKLAIILSIISCSILSTLGIKSLKSKTREKHVQFQISKYGTLRMGELVTENYLRELQNEYYSTPTMLDILVENKSYKSITLIQTKIKKEDNTKIRDNIELVEGESQKEEESTQKHEMRTILRLCSIFSSSMIRVKKTLSAF
jgi:hypothetical protein